MYKQVHNNEIEYYDKATFFNFSTQLCKNLTKLLQKMIDININPRNEYYQ